jgi:hypothetical protein
MIDGYTYEDIEMIKRIILGYVPSSTEMLVKYDLNHDGKINSTDLAYVKRIMEQNAKDGTRDPQTPLPYPVGVRTGYQRIGDMTYYWQYERDGKWHRYSQGGFTGATTATGEISDEVPVKIFQRQFSKNRTGFWR